MTHFLDWPEFRSRMYHRSYASRGYTTSGVYVVQFPDRVKVGKAGHVRTRISQHRRNGATRAVALGTQDAERVERLALRALDQVADRIGASESFTGISFIEAEGVLTAITRDYLGNWPEIILTWQEVPS
jgi:hypothetical protein